MTASPLTAALSVPRKRLVWPNVKLWLNPLPKLMPMLMLKLTTTDTMATPVSTTATTVDTDMVDTLDTMVLADTDILTTIMEDILIIPMWLPLLPLLPLLPPKLRLRSRPSRHPLLLST